MKRLTEKCMICMIEWSWFLRVCFHDIFVSSANSAVVMIMVKTSHGNALVHAGLIM